MGEPATQDPVSRNTHPSKDVPANVYLCQICQKIFPTRYHLQQHSIFEHSNLLDVATTTTENSGLASVTDSHSKFGCNTQTSTSGPVDMVRQSDNISLQKPERAPTNGPRDIQDMVAMQQQYNNTVQSPVQGSLMHYMPYPPHIYGHYSQMYSSAFGHPNMSHPEQGMDLSVKTKKTTHKKKVNSQPKKKLKSNKLDLPHIESQLGQSPSEADSMESFPESTSDPSENVVPEGSKHSKPPPTVYICVQCNDRRFTQSGNFHIHMRTHLESDRHCKCGICEVICTDNDLLEAHMKEHSGDKPYLCKVCGRGFSQNNNLKRHLRVHNGNVFRCRVCSREFNESFYLEMHLATHTGDRTYKCGICSQAFTDKRLMKNHVKTHKAEDLHTCDVCGLSFSKACVLRQHKKRHTGERPYSCDLCGKSFVHRHHLMMHNRSHNSEKPYKCDICLKLFSQSSHLYKHTRNHEMGKIDSFGRPVPEGNAIQENENQIAPLSPATASVEENLTKIFNKFNSNGYDQGGTSSLDVSSSLYADEMQDNSENIPVQAKLEVPLTDTLLSTSENVHSPGVDNGNSQNKGRNLSGARTSNPQTISENVKLEHVEHVEERSPSEPENTISAEHPPDQTVRGSQKRKRKSPLTVVHIRRNNQKYNTPSPTSSEYMTSIEEDTDGAELCDQSKTSSADAADKPSKDQDMNGAAICDSLQNTNGMASTQRDTFLSMALSSRNCFVKESDLPSYPESDRYSNPIGSMGSTVQQIKREPFSQHESKCLVCAVEFSNSKSLEDHSVVHFEHQTETKCGICHVQFKEQSHLLTHLNIHFTTSPYVCAVCPSSDKGETFGHIEDLSCHVLSHHGVHAMFLCEICGRGFGGSLDFETHLLSHTSESYYPCKLCGKVFLDAEPLFRHGTVHLRKTENVSSLFCDICQKIFEHEQTMDLHKRAQNTYRCNYCNLGFCNSHLLQSHLHEHARDPENGPSLYVRKLSPILHSSVCQQGLKLPVSNSSINCDDQNAGYYSVNTTPIIEFTENNNSIKTNEYKRPPLQNSDHNVWAIGSKMYMSELHPVSSSSKNPETKQKSCAELQTEAFCDEDRHDRHSDYQNLHNDQEMTENVMIENTIRIKSEPVEEYIYEPEIDQTHNHDNRFSNSRSYNSQIFSTNDSALISSNTKEGEPMDFTVIKDEPKSEGENLEKESVNGDIGIQDDKIYSNHNHANYHDNRYAGDGNLGSVHGYKKIMESVIGNRLNGDITNRDGMKIDNIPSNSVQSTSPTPQPPSFHQLTAAYKMASNPYLQFPYNMTSWPFTQSPGQTEALDFSVSHHDHGIDQSGAHGDHLSNANHQPHQCDTCHKTFTDRTHLQEHKKLHSKNEPYTCGSCYKVFKESSNLSEHLQSHEGFEETALCDICGKGFLNRRSYHSHVRNHTADKCFACHICDRTFSQNHNLQRHLMSHNSKCFKCEVCGRTFKEIYYLQMHLKIHTGLFSCSLCKMGFSDSVGLQKHYKGVHPGQEPVSVKKREQNGRSSGDGKNEELVQKNDLGNSDVAEDEKLQADSISSNGCLDASPYQGSSGAGEESCGSYSSQSQDELIIPNSAPDNSTLKINGTEISSSKEVKRCAEYNKTGQVHYGEQKTLGDLKTDSLNPLDSPIFSEPETHTCEICQLNFSDSSQLEYHMTSHKDGSSFKCMLCPKTFGTVKEISAHRRVHIEGKNICTVCGKELSKNTSKAKHMRTHGVKPFKCSFCPKTTLSKETLDEHEKTHTSNKPFRCEICGNNFQKLSELQCHLSTHTAKHPFQCTVCLHAFSSRAGVEEHLMLVHGKIVPPVCSVCDWQTENEALLRDHMSSNHMQEIPLKCDMCAEVFGNNDDLKKHMQMHNERRYVCRVCSEEHSDLEDYIAHLKTHGSSKMPFQCNICGHEFNNGRDLKNHLGVHSGERPYVCHICGKGFAKTCILWQHQKTHSNKKPYKCMQCDKSFRHNHHLQIHNRLHSGEKPYICHICGDGFRHSSNLPGHIRNHHPDVATKPSEEEEIEEPEDTDDPRPYKCEICDKSFKANRYLQIHNLLHNGEEQAIRVQLARLSDHDNQQYGTWPNESA